MNTKQHFLLPRCTGMNCGATDANHSPECRAEHAAAVAGGRFVKDAAPIAPRADADTAGAEYKRMFEDAVCALAAIDKALGIDPDEAGGAAPILEAIERLRDDGNCNSCVGERCVTGPECVTLGRDAAGASERADAEKDAALTDARINNIADRFWSIGHSGARVFDCLGFARAILAANGEKK